MNNKDNKIDNKIDSSSIKKIKIGILDPLGQYDNPLTNKPYSESYRELSKIWSKFPAYEDAEKIIKDIEYHNVLLVISGTGSGKTVLVPKYVLHALNYSRKIAITLPKQMIAKSSAKFAAETLDVELGKEVGYQYRGAGKGTFNDQTKLLYCTDGTLVARLLSDPLLLDFDAVVVDEAHERKVNIDFLLYMLRNVLTNRKDFKLIIMSATINEQIFRDYFQVFNYKNIMIGGKTNYPIESFFLKDNPDISKNEYLKVGTEKIKKLLESEKTKEGGILFFVTSINETNDICDLLEKDVSGLGDSALCIPVYSDMDPDKEKMATDKDYYREFTKNGRKLLIATNVAESSLTIEGIKYVIDSGLELRSRYDPVNRIDILEKTMITHAQVKQRMGRTGRTGPGTCYHLYTEKMFNETMDRFPSPSIRTESINYELLRLLNTPNINSVKELRTTLQEFIEPPKDNYVEAEIDLLQQLDLIDSTKDDGKLTDLGSLVSDLQTQPNEALCMLMAYRLNCFREVTAILSVIQTVKGSITKLFTLPLDILEESEFIDVASKGQIEWLTNKFNSAKKRFDNRYGDHIAILKIFKEFEKKRKDHKKLSDWSYRYFINKNVLESSYELYEKSKRRYRRVLSDQIEKQSKQSAPKLDKSVLETNLTYRIMAALMYGFRLNRLNMNRGKIETSDKKVKNIQIEKYSFLDMKTDTKKELFYNQLFRYNDTPIRAKIVSVVSKKSIDILKKSQFS